MDEIMQINVREYGRAIQNGQSRETDNRWAHKKKKNTTQYVLELLCSNKHK